MRRTIVLLTAVTLVAVMFIPATSAAPPAADRILPRAAEGTGSWVNTGWDVWKTTKKGVEHASGTEDGTWTGTFEGTSTDSFAGVFKPSGAFFGLLTVKFEGAVGDLTGSLEILTTFEVLQEDLDAPMTGTWMIVAGTDELANLRGEGTWVYEGDDPTSHAAYTGLVKEFVPEA
jgi:hypothetical protein